MSVSKLKFRKKEFVAHGSNVNCLSLGHKSGRVLVTGGDDKKVNLWAVGKPNCILSLSGHSTAVECVRFGASEELVCAGSLSGALKIWDLEATKIVRTLTGHKANIRSIDFHPYGDFICTGSLDTNIKLWDIRRKGCIFTYKGHNLTVNSLKFSPDGQWIASAGEDCAVKLWDLRAGKMLTEFASHTGPVSDVEFHPHEFLLASASHDRTVNFWDLEKFSLVSTTDADTGPVRTIAFHPTGECIYAGATDVLKVYGWEPNRCLDTVAMGWGKISDVAIAQNQLIGAAYHGIHVSLYVVDLARVQPFGGPATEAPPFRHGAPLRKSFIKDKGEGKASLASLKTEEASDTGGDETVEETGDSLQIDNIGAFRDAFGRQRELQRTPPPNSNVSSASISNNNVPQATTTPDLIRPIARRPTSPISVINTPSPEQMRRTNFAPQKNTRFDLLSAASQPAISNLQSERRRGSTNDLSTIHSSPHRYPIQSSPSEPYLVRQSSSPGPPPMSSSPPVKYPPSNPQSHAYQQHRQSVTSIESRQSSKSIQSSNEIPSKLTDRSYNSRSEPQTVISFMGTPKEPVDYSYRPEKLTDQDYLGPYSAGINIEDFLPKQFNALSLANIGGLPNGLTGITGTEMSEQEVLSCICRGHSNMASVLQTRVRGLQAAHRTWLTKDLRTAVEHVLNITDQALLVDFLAILNLRPSIWNLDILTLLLPPVSLLMQSKYEAYCTCGADTLKLMIKNFAPMIRSNMGGPIHSVGIDISREERYNKCMECYNHLMSIRAFLLKRQTVPGKLGHLYRELVIIMQALD